MQYVDETVLDSNLTSVANSIRGKTRTVGQLLFPTGFVIALDGLIHKNEHMQPLLNGVSYKSSTRFDGSPTQAIYTSAFDGNTILNNLAGVSVADYVFSSGIDDFKVYRIDSVSKEIVRLTSSTYVPAEDGYVYLVSNKLTHNANATAVYLTTTTADFYNALLLMFGGTV